MRLLWSNSKVFRKSRTYQRVISIFFTAIFETDKQDEVYIAWNTEAISDSALNLTELSITQQVTALNELQELETVIKIKQMNS